MQQHICEVVTAGFETEQPAIEHVGNPSKRMPVAGMDISKGPRNSMESETGGDFRVFVDVPIVVVIEEIVMQRLPENEPGKRDQSYANCNDPPLVVWCRGVVVADSAAG